VADFGVAAASAASERRGAFWNPFLALCALSLCRYRRLRLSPQRRL